MNPDMTPAELADEMAAAIAHAIQAHSHFPITPRHAIRYWDGRTPFAIHPIWCAMTLLGETRLPDAVRHEGYLTLLWHDILEDSTLGLPAGCPPRIRGLVEEMTFDGLDDEFVRLWERGDMVKLLKLYDKVSQFFDGTWLTDQRWNRLLEHTLRLQAFVESTYGELNIVRIARAVCRPRGAGEAR